MLELDAGTQMEEVLRAIPKLDPEEKIFFCRGFECGLASLDPESGQLQEFNYLAMSVVGHEIDTIFAMHWAGSPLARHCPLASRFDFGLAERFIENGLPRKHSGVPRFKGTPKYASLAAHTRITTTSKDDIEAWCYSLIELLPGLFRGTSTPWKKER
uniref:Uncharacterized protein n=1 Tax=Globodera rostochiensis TaxID=31243 RepID=A0A914HYF5_GLORO